MIKSWQRVCWNLSAAIGQFSKERLLARLTRPSGSSEWGERQARWRVVAVARARSE